MNMFILQMHIQFVTLWQQQTQEIANSCSKFVHICIAARFIGKFRTKIGQRERRVIFHRKTRQLSRCDLYSITVDGPSHTHTLKIAADFVLWKRPPNTADILPPELVSAPTFFFKNRFVNSLVIRSILHRYRFSIWAHIDRFGSKQEVGKMNFGSHFYRRHEKGVTAWFNGQWTNGTTDTRNFVHIT